MTRDLIPTATGTVARGELGFTLPHEHLQYGVPGWEHDFLTLVAPESRRRAAIDAATAMVASGVRTIVDLTPMETARDLDLLTQVADATGLQVIFATGLHSLRPVPYFVRSTEAALARLFTAELGVGAAGTRIRPAVIKAGVGGVVMTDHERNVVGAAATAAVETDSAVAIHVEEGGGRDAVRLLLGRGVAPHRILVAHVDSTSDAAYHRELADAGVMLGFDRFGNVRYQSDEARTTDLLALIEAGYTDQLLVSQDYPVVLLGREGVRRDTDESLAEWTSTHLIERALPRLREQGLTATSERTLTHDNPVRWLAG